jgi:hypothetical protein
MAANTYQSIKPTDERPAINERESEDVTEVRRELRSKDGPKIVKDSRAASSIVFDPANIATQVY